MSRGRQRATLECGLKLELNRLARKGFVQPGAYRSSGIRWTSGYTGEEIASGYITADMSGSDEDGSALNSAASISLFSSRLVRAISAAGSGTSSAHA